MASKVSAVVRHEKGSQQQQKPGGLLLRPGTPLISPRARCRPPTGQTAVNGDTVKRKSNSSFDCGIKMAGLYENIARKRARIASGSDERMRKPGSKGAPSAADFKAAAKTAKKSKSSKK